MTVIYVDTLFLLNAIVDYLLLLCAARVAGEPLHRGRFLVAAILGGAYAVGIFLPGMGFLSHPILRVAMAVMMVLVGFGRCPRLLRQSLIFFALTCAFGGGVLAISLFGGRGMALTGGVLYSAMDLKTVLLSAAGCYAMLSLLFRKWGRHTATGGQIALARVKLDNRAVAFPVLIDTGNTLSDPVSGKGVVVVDYTAIQRILPENITFKEHEIRNPTLTIQQYGGTALASRLRLLPYRAVGIDMGMLLALRVDGVELNGQSQGGMLIALSPTAVSDGGAYRGLVGAPE